MSFVYFVNIKLNIKKIDPKHKNIGTKNKYVVLYETKSKYILFIDCQYCHNPLPVWDAPVDALQSGEDMAAAYVSQDGNLIIDFKTTNTHFRNKL